MQVSQRRSLLIIVDILLVNVALLLALWLGAQRSAWPFSLQFAAMNFYWFLLPTAGYLILATVNDAYDLKVASDFTAIAWAVVRVTIEILFAYLVVYFVFPPASLPRHIIGFFSLILPVTLLTWRWVYIGIFSHPGLRRRAIIVGAGKAGRTIGHAVGETMKSYYELVGFVDDDPDKQGRVYGGVPVLASTAELSSLCQRLNVSELVVAISRNMRAECFQSVLTCHELGLKVTPMALLYEQLLGRVPVEHVGDNWSLVLPITSVESFTVTMMIKRLLDVFVAVFGLAVFCVLLPFTALAIRLDSRGPIFYRQVRVGRGGKTFRLLKLRSMVADAENDGVARWADKNDSRITGVGRFLRRARLDEMPQFYNVLVGEMSLIGPRPERPEFVDELARQIPFYRARLAVRPGLTGWAQTRYPYGSSTEDSLVKLQYDLFYIKHLSLYLDLLICLRTVGVVLSLKGRQVWRACAQR